MRNHPPVAYRRWQATLILTLFFFSVAGAAGIGWWYAREAYDGNLVSSAKDP